MMSIWVSVSMRSRCRTSWRAVTAHFCRHPPETKTPARGRGCFVGGTTRLAPDGRLIGRFVSLNLASGADSILALLKPQRDTRHNVLQT
jgi:hypothetical protein